MKQIVLATAALICMTVLPAIAEDNSSRSEKGSPNQKMQAQRPSTHRKHSLKEQGQSKQSQKHYGKKDESPKYDPLETTLDLYN